jgi:hypothetical protein
MQKGERLRAESGPDSGADDEIEQLIATGGARVIGAEPKLLRSAVQFADIGVQRIESRMAAHGVSIGQKFNRQLQLP